MASSSALHAQGGGVKITLFANQIIKFTMILAGAAFSIYLGTQISDPDVNGLATSVQYAAVCTFVVAVVSPKTGIYLVLFMCPYLDFVKRLLVLFSNTSMMDVTIVLAMAPVTMAGAFIGTFGSRMILKKSLFDPGEKPLFLIMMGASAVIILGAVLHSSGSKMDLLHELGESCVYLSLLYLVPVHFPDAEQIAKVFRLCVLLFVPVALYGFWQQAYGLADFENRYLLSGFTVMSNDYFENGRVFSTLNSNHAFSVTMACCAMIAWLLRYLPAPRGWAAWVKSFAWLFSLLFACACVISLRRTGWLVIGFSALGAFCFRSRRRTQIFYAFCLSSLLLIIFNAETLYTKLPYWDASLQTMFPGFDQATQLQTFNDRLASFETLTGNTDLWSWFGVPLADRGDLYVHDAISQTLLAYGVVGGLALIAILALVLVISHRVVWRARDAAERWYAALLLSLLFSNLFVGAVMQSHIGIFPINFLFWLCVGALMTVTFKRPAIEAADFDLATLQAIIESSSQGKPLPTLG